MAFKTVTQYNEERYGGLFQLRNDGEFKDIIFLYQNVDDVLIADTHYIKSADYSGYCHCNGRGCPACGKGIRVQTKLFIPVYDIENNEIVFWDRGSRFEQQLMNDVLLKYPNPSEYVFRITRKGAANDINTTYSIMAVGKNTVKSYAEILSENNATFPEYYSNICREFSSADMSIHLNQDSESTGSSNLQDYQAIPRNTVPTPTNYTPSGIPGQDMIPDSPFPDDISDDVDGEGPDF